MVDEVINMGMGRFIHSKVRNDYDIIQDLKSAGIVQEEIDRHAFLNDIYEKKTKKLGDVEKQLKKVEKEEEDVDEKIEAYEKKLSKMREKAGRTNIS